MTSVVAGSTPAIHPFDPIIDENSKILILGSFPSIKSFENNFYYAHPRNQFWSILSAIFNRPVFNSINLPTSLLPSPAYAALSFEVKLKRWNDILTNYLLI